VGEKVAEMDAGALSLILRLAHTLTAKARSASGDHYFRSVASAGALYPTELYVATQSLRGLDDGLYHFAIHRHCLYPIRAQNITPHVVRFIPVGHFFQKCLEVS
jgi:SagB-type dehydrogenase family enzyme